MIQSDIESVLDTSVVLAALKQEQAPREALSYMANAAISVVNLAEVVTKLTEWAVPREVVASSLADLSLKVLPFDENLAVEAGLLHGLTKGRNISLGGRACLVTARHFGVPAVTADRAWADLDIGVIVELIR